MSKVLGPTADFSDSSLNSVRFPCGFRAEFSARKASGFRCRIHVLSALKSAVGTGPKRIADTGLDY